MNNPADQPTRADVHQAAARLRGQVARTPVVSSPELDRIAGTSLYLKAENLQPGGSYKLRGALHAVGRVAQQRRAPGVIAQSTGNHAIAVALAAQRHGLGATVVLPTTAPAVKAEQCRAAGARVVVTGTTVEDRLERVRELRAASGYEVIDAYDHPHVITGQGTASQELIGQTAAGGAALDALVVPVGGGGGVAGACLAAEDTGIRVFGVEPAGGDGLTQSLAAGRLVAVPSAPTLADGLMPARPGQLAYDIARSRIAGTVTVTDDSLRRAVVLALVQLKLVLEPSGAAGLAAALDGAFADFRRVGIILTGGNIEPALISQLVGAHLEEAGDGAAAAARS